MPRAVLSLESLRARFERTGHQSCAFKARALAARLGVDVPAWCTKRRPSRDRLDLDGLRERHDRSGMPVDRRARYRMRARRLALALRVTVPEWAKRALPAPPKVKPPAHAKPARGKPRSARTPTRPLSARGASVALREIPAPLRAWREARPCRVVQMTVERVTLHERGAPSRSFNCAADAIAAVASTTQ
jgi:hypothetical protein